jgi:sugar phosphate isomerase/epimerase
LDRFKFRLGSTSYVYPDDILPNVRQLGPIVEDVELVLFEVEDFSNLPNVAQIAELRQLAAQHDLTYTVHLPLDLRVVSGDPSLALARKVIALTRPLDPFAYVAHLNAREPMERGNWAAWREGCIQGLQEMAEATGDMGRISIENLERWPHEEMYPILERIPVSFCLDIGHLWLQGLDVPAVIQRLAARTRVVHLHGIAERDHKSLTHVPPAQLRAALDALDQADYRGVVTLEVFSCDDFFPSRDLVLEWMASR